MLSEAMVRHVVGQEGAHALVEITEGAWSDYLKEDRIRYHRSTQASVVWDYMALRGDDRLRIDGVRRELRQERPLYVLRDALVLRPKKHGRDSLTRNYPTSAQKNVLRTGFFEELPYPHIMFGYKLDRAEAGIEQVILTSPADSWIIDLGRLADGEVTPTAAMFDMPDYDEPWRQIAPIGRQTGFGHAF